MFQLYKERNFNALINDTFSFFRVYGKNYFGNYFIIVGPFLLILIVLAFIVLNFFFDTLMSAQGTAATEAMLANYFLDNLGYFIGMGTLAAVILLVLTILIHSFPVVYLDIIKTVKEPNAKQVMDGIKAKIGKSILFGLLYLITFLPITAIAALICTPFMLVLIGFPMVLFVMNFMFLWSILTFYNYLSTSEDYFTSMGRGIKMLTKKFWAHLGSTIIFIIITYMLQFVVYFFSLLVASVFGLISSSSLDTGDHESMLSFISVMAMIIWTMLIIVYFVTNNLTMVNLGMIYYSSKETEDRFSVHSEIDSIGNDGE